MRVDAAPEVCANAWAGGNNRVRIRIGVHRYTATLAEAAAFSARIADVVEQLHASTGPEGSACSGSDPR